MIYKWSLFHTYVSVYRRVTMPLCGIIRNKYLALSERGILMYTAVCIPQNNYLQRTTDDNY